MAEETSHGKNHYHAPNILAVREFLDFHGDRLEFSNSAFARTFPGPNRLSVPDFVKIR